MGVGRRMKKQGPPLPLDESRISSIQKRKASEAEFGARGKKRKVFGEVKESVQTGKTINEIANSGSKSRKKRPTDEGLNALPESFSVKGNFNGTTSRIEKGRNLAARHSVVKHTIHSEESMNDIINDSEDSILRDDGVLPDDFLDSGSSVYDSDPQHQETMFSDDEGDSDAEEKLTAANIEGLSRRLDEKKHDEAAEARLELEEAALQTNIDGDRPHIFEGTPDEDALAIARLAPDLQLLRSRIIDTVRVLEDFSKLSEEGRSRSEYTAQLLKDIYIYYGYSPYLAEKLFNLFPPREAFAFFEANETARPVVIRTNTLRTHRRDLAQSLINRGVTLEPVGKWSKVGLQIFESQVPLGATPEYLAGHYILQAASSFLPVMALAPQEHERILDMAAAPGGKTTYIAALMKNTGFIFANDSNKSRAKGLIGNIHRLGAKNTIVCNYDAREFPKVISGFDRVLLDAPCSGTGVIAKDPSVKTNKTEKDFMQLPHLQKQLLLSAIDSVDHASKTGGYIVYSTCSVTVEENEQVVQYALLKRPNVRLVETGLTFGVEGFKNYMGKTFNARMKMTRRFYPHKYNLDGFFVSKFKKFAPTISRTGAAASDPATHPNGAKNTDGTRFSDYDDGKSAKDGVAADEGDHEGSFEGFDDEGDQTYIDRALRSHLRRKGINPRAARRSVKPTGAAGVKSGAG